MDFQQRHQKEIPSEFHEQFWEQRALVQWQSIAAEFAVTEILIPDNWRLTLPKAIQGEGMILYEIPRP